MKRLLVIAAGVALGALGYLGAGMLVSAQPGAQPAGGSRVAMINMFVVTKGYTKIQNFNNELKALAKPYEEKIKKAQQSYQEWKKRSTDTKLSQDERDKAATNAKSWQRYYEDQSAEINKIIMERAEKHMVQVYREIEDAVSRYAKANGIQLVLHHFEPLDERYTAQNIQRKMAASGNLRAAGPLYVAEGVEISTQVLQMLNAQAGGQ